MLCDVNISNSVQLTSVLTLTLNELKIAKSDNVLQINEILFFEIFSNLV